MNVAVPQDLGERAEVVLFSHDAFFLDFALRLRHHGVSINALFVRSVEQFRGHFSDVELILIDRLRQPEVILQLNADDPACLSSADLERFVHLESVYLRTTDRLTYDATSVRSRLQLFRELLRFWLRFFEQRKGVGTIFFTAAPHMGEDLVAYHVAKSLGIRTLFVERSLLTNRVFLLEDYAAVDKVPAELLADDALDAIQARIDPALLAAVHQTSPWAKRSSDINRGIVASESVAPPRARAWRLAARWVGVARNLARPARSTAFWHHGGTIPGYRHELAQATYRRRIKKLRALYESMTSPPGSAPYVLFTLHMQPERSTCPQGGVYDDQLLAIETAAKALPAGYELYVKEHPRQFAPTRLNGRHYRDETFYRRLGAIPNVRLMAISSDTSKLIAGAFTTVTTTGSAGWESIVSGKPCLAFGTPWYSGCRSCHIVRSLDDCRAAYAACRTSTPDAVKRDLLIYLAYVQDRLIYSSNGTLFARGAQDYDTLVDNLALGLVRRLQHRVQS